jgi:ubiquinone/menaquinone biosynthesis C-methylase UbiE
MVKRKPVECGVFEDIETVRKYNKEVKKWMQNVSKSFVAVTRKWGIEEGNVLDVGTGTGLLAITFAENFAHMEVIGLDLSEEALEVARENARESEILNISFKKGDAEDMPFKDNTFTLVISSNTLHLIENPVDMFNEIHRVLNTDGKFFISDFKRSWLSIFSQHFRASYTPGEIRHLLQQSELQNWRLKDRFFWVSIYSEDHEF